MRMKTWLAHHLVALRAVLVLTVVLGLAYPLAMTAVAHIPGLRGPAQGSIAHRPDGIPIGSALIGQQFTDANGNPIPWYFQTRPSMAGNGYDPTSSAAGNLGPEDIVDTLPSNPADPSSGKQSLLTRICQRSKQVGALEGVDGGRPYCTPDGVGAVLGVFRAGGLTGLVTDVVSLNQACPARPFPDSYEGVPVRCAEPGAYYSKGVVTPIRGNAPAQAAVPPDAVTASGSGLDPDISPAYARLQAPRIARERGVALATVMNLVEENTTGRPLGVLGEPAVNALQLNLALDRDYPKRTA
jgi:K+-transporting ATPase ATPase C chain